MVLSHEGVYSIRKRNIEDKVKDEKDAPKIKKITSTPTHGFVSIAGYPSYSAWFYSGPEGSYGTRAPGK